MGDKAVYTLLDYSDVPKEWKETCVKLQKAINDGNCDVMDLSTLMNGGSKPRKSDDDDEGDCPSIFHYYGSRYMTGKYAGVLEYDGDVFLINSRFDEGVHTYFLQYALNKIGWDNIPTKAIQTNAPTAKGSVLYPLLVQVFLRCLEDAFQVGVYRQYRNFQHNDSKLRGPIDVSRHIRLNPLSNGRIAYNTRDYTIDNPMNRLILAAKQVLEQREDCSTILEKMLRENPSYAHPFQRLSRDLGAVHLSMSERRVLVQRMQTPITHPFHQRYEQVRKIALMILREEGIQPMAMEDERVSGLVIPMDRVWELFLESTVCKELGIKTQAEMKIIQGRRTLKPDFWKPNKNPDHCWVFDAKYRQAWEQANREKSWNSGVRNDVFQIMSYMYATQSRQGGVLFPMAVANEVGDTTIKPFQLFQAWYQPCKKERTEAFYIIPVPVKSSGTVATYEEYEEIMDTWLGQSREQLSGLLGGS